MSKVLQTIVHAFGAPTYPAMARFLVILGVILIAAGLLWPWLGKIGLGRLPGDIWIERENLTVVIPLGTSLVLSAALSVILWLIGR